MPFVIDESIRPVVVGEVAGEARCVEKLREINASSSFSLSPAKAHPAGSPDLLHVGIDRHRPVQRFKESEATEQMSATTRARG